MPRPRSAMRKIREVLRLSLGERLGTRQIAASLGLPRTTVRRYLERAGPAGLSWPVPEGMDDRELEGKLFGSPAASGAAAETRPVPDWAHVYRELKRPGVTLELLWLEWKEEHPDGYQHTQFWEHYRRWERRLEVVMRQEHRAGEKLFVDYPGQTIPITNPLTGEITRAEIFVAVLGASNYTYAEAFPSQELPHWIAGHVHAFEYMGGAAKILVPDNLRSGVTKAHRYEPDVNRTYLEMATHFGCAVIPARARKPRDKAKVEAGVLIVERWILARLRNRTFFSLAELNVAIGELLTWLNERPFKKLTGSRRSLFEDLDRPALRPLPAIPYEYATFKLVTVNIDYHVEVDRHWYSVPYQLARLRCEVRITANVVEVLHHGRRVASHVRSYQPHRHTTLAEHMPDSHRRHLEWTPERILNWARATGPHTTELVDTILRSRPHPEQGFRSCLGILRFAKGYENDRVEAASARAVAIGATSYRSFESILRSGLDRLPPPGPQPATLPLQHQNLRGPAYYN